jgi:hypothetical protein
MPFYVFEVYRFRDSFDPVEASQLAVEVEVIKDPP